MSRRHRAAPRPREAPRPKGLRKDGRPARASRSVSELLRSGQIRSHLKLLTVELIAAHPQTRDDELTVLIPWIDSEMNCRRTGQPNPDKLASRIWESFFSSRKLFVVADRIGFIQRWLHSGESWLEDLMVVYFRWQIEAHADRVAELLEPFVGRESAAHCRLLWNGPERRPVQTERNQGFLGAENQAIRVSAHRHQPGSFGATITLRRSIVLR